MDSETGRIRKSDTTEIVVRVDEYKGAKGVTVREYIKGKKYEGFTRRGTRIPFEKWQEFRNIVNMINP